VATWLELARENRTAASQLFKRSLFRAAINRAYYAAYSRVTHELNAVPVFWPKNREGPPHVKIPALIRDHLRTLRPKIRERIADMTAILYAMRCRADYHPSDTVDDSEARIALGMMKKIFDLL